MGVISIWEIGGAFVTLVLAILAYIKTEEEKEKIKIATLVLIFGAMFSILFSIRFENLPNLEKHTRFVQKVSESPDAFKAVKNLSATLSKIKEEKNPLMGYVFNLRLQNFNIHLQNFLNNRFSVNENEMPQFALELIKSVNKTFMSTSYVNFKEWWDTEWGLQYEDINIRKAQVGVGIERIFIFSKESEFEAARPHLDRQEEGGIQVFFAFSQNLEKQMGKDLVCIDDSLSGELRLIPDKGFLEAEFFTSRADIDRIKREIKNIELHARKYQPRAPGNAE